MRGLARSHEAFARLLFKTSQLIDKRSSASGSPITPTTNMNGNNPHKWSVRRRVPLERWSKESHRHNSETSWANFTILCVLRALFYCRLSPMWIEGDSARAQCTLRTREPLFQGFLFVYLFMNNSWTVFFVYLFVRIPISLSRPSVHEKFYVREQFMNIHLQLAF